MAEPLHIGIVGCSSEGAALCYRTICVEAAALLGQHAHPEVSMHTPSLSRYVDCLQRDDWAGVADLMLASANKLAGLGAQLLICPDNTIHRAFDAVERVSPVPWLHIAEPVAALAAQRGYRRLGVTGTGWLVRSDVYASRIEPLGIELLRPHDTDCETIDRIIMDELTYGIFKPESVAFFQQAIARLAERGCEAVILGCTEIPLIIDDSNSPLPTLDSTRLLARAALQRACEGFRL